MINFKRSGDSLKNQEFFINVPSKTIYLPGQQKTFVNSRSHPHSRWSTLAEVNGKKNLIIYTMSRKVYNQR